MDVESPKIDSPSQPLSASYNSTLSHSNTSTASSTISSFSPTATSSAQLFVIDRDKALILCLGILLPVFVFVTIVLCCKFSCGRQRKKTLAREKSEDEKLKLAEERAMNEQEESTDDESLSDSEEEKLMTDKTLDGIGSKATNGGSWKIRTAGLLGREGVSYRQEKRPM